VDRLRSYLFHHCGVYMIILTKGLASNTHSKSHMR